MTEDVWQQVTRQLYPSQSTGVNNGADGTENDKDRKDGDGDQDEENDIPLEKKTQVVNKLLAVESYALCVGMPGAGKSSLLNTYLNPSNDGIPKPTVALEYMFARRASVANAPKDVAHIWELGGGSYVGDLVRVPITPRRFNQALYIIVLDLSKPSSILPHLIHWTEQIKACVKLCVRELGRRDSNFADKLKKSTYAKLGRDHPDLRIVRPCPVPLVLVGNKYDTFKNQESVRKRTLAQALRFIAHINGASLLFCSIKDKNLKDVFRSTLNTHLFRSSTSRRMCETNPEKPLVVSAGSDSLEDILKHTPAGTRREDFVSGNKSIAEGAMNAWGRAVEDVFGPADPDDPLPSRAGEEDYSGGRESSSKGDDDNNNNSSNPFPEPSVDERRAERDEILRRYQKEAERKAKMSRKAIADTGTKGSSSASRAANPALSRTSRSSKASHPSESKER